MSERQCIIVNMSGPLDPNRIGDEKILPAEVRPSYVHDSLNEARAECLRLHKQHAPSGGRFVIFQAVEFSEWRKNFVITEPLAVAVLESFDAAEVKPISERARKRKQRAGVPALPSTANSEPQTAN